MAQQGAAPFETIGADGEIGGFQAEVLSSLASALGLKLKPQVYADWPSVLRAVREGDADMVMTLAVTPDRLAYLEFTLGTVPVPTALFSRVGSKADPRRANFAMEREFYANYLLKRLYPEAGVTPTDTTIEALREVSTGRSDFYLGSLLEAIDALKHQPLPGIEVREVLQAMPRQYHFGVRKDWAPLAHILSKGIARSRSHIEARAMAGVAASLPASATLLAPMTMSEQEIDQLSRQPVWRVGAVRGLALLNEFGAEGRHSGVGADYIEHVAHRLGVVVQVMPFDSVAAMLDGLRQRRIDVVPFLTQTPEREREFAYSKSYIEMPYMLVTRSDAPLYWDLGSLRGKRLALPREHPALPMLARSYPEVQVVVPPAGRDAMGMVADGDADAAMEVKLYANLRINSDSGARLRTSGEVKEAAASFGIAVAPEWSDRLPLINRALDEISLTERERLLRRWVAVDLNPAFPWRRHLATLGVAGAALMSLIIGTLWWMRRLAREVKQRQQLLEKLDDIGRAMPGATFRYVMDAKGGPLDTHFSSGTQAFLGVEPQQNQSVFDLVRERLPPAQAEEGRRLQSLSRRTRQPFKYTGLYAHPDGRQLWLHCAAVCHPHADGGCTWTGYVVDISPERELQQRLADQAEERHVLLASASHELRAPTHTLSLALQAIPEGGVPESSARPLRIAREAARTLAQLLDDVLDAARFQSRSAPTAVMPAPPVNPAQGLLRWQDFDLRVLLEQVHEAHTGAAAAKGLRFERELAADVPQIARGDPLRLKQVLTNVLSNAIKYTAVGHVRWRVAMQAWPDGRPALVFEISDSGPGIDAARRARLFEPFGNAPMVEGSTGLGLSICRRWLELMGGTITLDSAAAGGTSVQVALPITARKPGELPQHSRLQEGAVLLCDDDPVSRMLMAEALRNSGYVVAEAAQGREALARWREGGIRVLITDLTMPEMGGVQLIAAIRAEQPGDGERTAIVVCSGDPAPELPEGGPEHDAYLSKPLDLRTLTATLLELGIAPASNSLAGGPNTAAT
jgi:two-component system, NarL family, sensor histidine kinase EvgS